MLWEVNLSQASWMIKKILKAQAYFEKSGYAAIDILNMNCFSIKRMYLRLRGIFLKVPWRRMVCNNLECPKCIFTLRFAAQCKLYTRDRLAKWGINSNQA